MAGRQNQSEGTVIPSSHLVRHSPPARRMAATKGASPRLPASLSIRCIQRPPKKADPSPFRLNGGRRGAGRGIFCAHARTDPLPPPDKKIPFPLSDEKKTRKIMTVVRGARRGARRGGRDGYAGGQDVHKPTRRGEEAFLKASSPRRCCALVLRPRRPLRAAREYFKL